MANELDLKDKQLVAPQLKENLAVASYTETQKAVPRGDTPVKSGIDSKAYIPYSRNPVVKNAIDTLTSAVFWPDWTIKSRTDLDTNPELEELDNSIINLIKDNLDNLDYDSFDNVLRAIVHANLVHGFSVSEEVWDSIDGIWFMTDIKPKPSFEFDINVDTGDTNQSFVYSINGETLDIDKFILTTYPYLRDGNPYGISELEYILTDIDALEELERIFTIGSASSMNKTVLHYADFTGRSETQTKSINTTIDNGLRSDGGILHLPANTHPETEKLMEADIVSTMDDRASEEALPAVENRILELEKRINRNFGIPDDLGQATVSGGSLARAEVEFTTFAAKRNTIADFVRAFVNKQIVKRIIFYNYDNLPENYVIPIWDFQEFEEDDFQKTATSARELVESQIITKTEARELMKFPPLDESEIAGEPDADPNSEI